MDLGFFPVAKKAAPTKIFGRGFMLLKVTVMAFLVSIAFGNQVGAAAAAGVVVVAGLPVSLLRKR